mgnify:CR=1 FL=1
MSERDPHIRTCFYTSSASWTNHQRWPYEVGRALFERGYPVEILTSPHGRLYAKGKRYGMDVSKFKKSGFLPADVLRLARRLRQDHITTLFLNYPPDLKMGALAARIAGIRNVVFRRGTVSSVRKNPINRWILKRLITTVITNSDANRRWMLRSKSSMFRPESTRVVYNGLNVSGQRAASSSYHDYRNNGELMVGVMTGDVQPSRFLNLFELIRRERKQDAANFRFLIHGNGQLIRSLKQKLKRNPELQKMLVWDSRSRNLVEFMNSIDVFVTGNTSNGFNHPLMYAMARYKPVIAYNEGSNPEIIRNNETGFLLNKGDVQGVKEKLDMLRNRDLRLRLGKEARRRLEGQFNEEHSIDQIEALLR